MRAGKLRIPVAIDRNCASRDDSGSVVPKWVPFIAECWASIEPLSAREFIAAQSLHTEVSCRITVRWQPGITGAMRVRRLDDGRVYAIVAPLEDNHSGREWITLPCGEGLSDG